MITAYPPPRPPLVEQSKFCKYCSIWLAMQTSVVEWCVAPCLAVFRSRPVDQGFSPERESNGIRTPVTLEQDSPSKEGIEWNSDAIDSITKRS